MGEQTLKFEAASTFVLWMLGKPHDSIVLLVLPLSNYPLMIYSAMLEMRRYLKLETNESIIFNENQLSSRFLRWAKAYLGPKFETTVKEKKSIVKACSEALNKWSWLARVISSLELTQSAEQEFNESSDDAISSRAQNCFLRKADFLTLGIQRESETRFADLECVLLDVLLHREGPEHSDWKRNSSIEDLSPSVIRRLDSKLTLVMAKMKSMQDSVNREIARERPRMLPVRELWDGKAVKLAKNRSISLWVTWTHEPLRIHVPPKVDIRIKGARRHPTIHFLPEKVILRVGTETVFSRLRVYVESGQGAELWRIQFKKELDFKKLNMSSAHPESTLTVDIGSFQVPPHPVQANSRNAGANAARRYELLRGSYLHCSTKGLGNMGRVNLRHGLFVILSSKADSSTVWIRCDLRSKGEVHPQACTTVVNDIDPAKRLGILVRYKEKGGNETKQLWYQVNTEREIKMTNSLVDFLDGENENWTASQPRRYIPAKKGSNPKPERFT